MHTLTLQDVADLAKVRRPVVSMWRKRPMVRGVSMPFPDPVETVDGVARFTHTEVVDWLDRTGRGNNPEHHDDAPALAVPDGAQLEDVVTLLCWHVLTGEDLEGTSLTERIRRAEEFDPDDVYLASEIRELRVSDAVLAYVDDLVEATLGPRDALARLESGRLKRVLGLRDLTEEAVGLLRCIVEAAAVHLEQDRVVLGVEGSAVALDVAEACELDITSSDRALRRRALIRGIHIGEHIVQKRVSAQSLVGLDIVEALDRVDEVVVGLGAGDVVVVLGPAAALSDELAGTSAEPSSRDPARRESCCGDAPSARALARGAPAEPRGVGVPRWSQCAAALGRGPCGRRSCRTDGSRRGHRRGVGADRESCFPVCASDWVVDSTRWRAGSAAGCARFEAGWRGYRGARGSCSPRDVGHDDTTGTAGRAGRDIAGTASAAAPLVG